MGEEAAETADRRLNGKIPIAGWAHATGVRPLFFAKYLTEFAMSHRILALVATTTFVGGLMVGHYGLPRVRTVMTSLAKNEAAPNSPNSFSQPCPTSQPTDLSQEIRFPLLTLLMRSKIPSPIRQTGIRTAKFVI